MSETHAVARLHSDKQYMLRKSERVNKLKVKIILILLEKSSRNAVVRLHKATGGFQNWSKPVR